MIHSRLWRVLKLAAITIPALMAGLAGQLHVPAGGQAEAAPLVVETWNGVSNTLWNNTFNWTPNGDPSLSDTCIIPSGKPRYPLIGSADIGQCGSITIDSGGQVNLNNGIMQAASAIFVSGALNEINNSSLEPGNLLAVNPGGTLVLNNIGPGGVHFTANGFVSVSGTMQVTTGATGVDMSGGNPPAHAANLVVNPGGLFQLNDSMGLRFTLDGSVTNHGTMSQTATVAGPTRFLSITSAYIGLIITPSTSLGSTAVSVQGDQTCSGLTASVKRCYLITPTLSVSSTVQFFYLNSEANGNSLPSVFRFNSGTSSWQVLPSTRGGNAPNLFVRASGITSYGRFALYNSPSLFLPLIRR